jgi:hypothetical protein
MKIRAASTVFAAAAVAVTWASAGSSSLEAHGPPHGPPKRAAAHEGRMCVEAPADPPPCAVPPGTGR